MERSTPAGGADFVVRGTGSVAASAACLRPFPCRLLFVRYSRSSSGPPSCFNVPPARRQRRQVARLGAAVVWQPAQDISTPVEFVDLRGWHVQDNTVLVVSHVTGRTMRTIDLSIGARAMSDLGAQYLCRKCEHLRNLDLSSATGLTDIGIIALSTGCPHIATMILSKCARLTDRSLRAVAERCPGLRVLHTQHCRQLTDAGFAALWAGCQNIRNVNTMGCVRVSGSSFLTIPPANQRTQSLFCPGVHSLGFRGCRLTDAALSWVCHSCPNLTQLDVSFCDKITSVGAMLLAKHCHGLAHLSLSGCPQISSRAISALGSECRLLRSVELMWLSNADDDASRALLAGPVLINAGFACTGCTSNGCLLPLPRRPPLLWMKNIRALNLANLPFVSDTTLRVVAAQCPNLDGFNCSGCPRVSDAGLMILSAACRNIDTLKLMDCPEIGTTGLLFLVKMLPCLRVLDLSTQTVERSAQRVSDYALRALLRSAHKLSVLGLCNCAMFSAGCFHGPMARRISEIFLSGALSLSTFGTAALAHGCSNVSLLQISNVATVGRGQLAAFLKMIEREKRRRRRRTVLEVSATFFGLEPVESDILLARAMEDQDCYFRRLANENKAALFLQRAWWKFRAERTNPSPKLAYAPHGVGDDPKDEWGNDGAKHAPDAHSEPEEGVAESIERTAAPLPDANRGHGETLEQKGDSPIVVARAREAAGKILKHFRRCQRAASAMLPEPALRQPEQPCWRQLFRTIAQEAANVARFRRVWRKALIIPRRRWGGNRMAPQMRKPTPKPVQQCSRCFAARKAALVWCFHCRAMYCEACSTIHRNGDKCAHHETEFVAHLLPVPPASLVHVIKAANVAKEAVAVMLRPLFSSYASKQEMLAELISTLTRRAEEKVAKIAAKQTTQSKRRLKALVVLQRVFRARLRWYKRVKNSIERQERRYHACHDAWNKVAEKIQALARGAQCRIRLAKAHSMDAGTGSELRLRAQRLVDTSSALCVSWHTRKSAERVLCLGRENANVFQCSTQQFYSSLTTDLIGEIILLEKELCSAGNDLEEAIGLALTNSSRPLRCKMARIVLDHKIARRSMCHDLLGFVCRHGTDAKAELEGMALAQSEAEGIHIAEITRRIKQWKVLLELMQLRMQVLKQGTPDYKSEQRLCTVDGPDRLRRIAAVEASWLASKLRFARQVVKRYDIERARCVSREEQRLVGEKCFATAMRGYWAELRKLHKWQRVAEIERCNLLCLGLFDGVVSASNCAHAPSHGDARQGMRVDKLLAVSRMRMHDIRGRVSGTQLHVKNYVKAYRVRRRKSVHVRVDVKSLNIIYDSTLAMPKLPLALDVNLEFEGCAWIATLPTDILVPGDVMKVQQDFKQRKDDLHAKQLQELQRKKLQAAAEAAEHEVSLQKREVEETEKQKIAASQGEAVAAIMRRFEPGYKPPKTTVYRRLRRVFMGWLDERRARDDRIKRSIKTRQKTSAGYTEALSGLRFSVGKAEDMKFTEESEAQKKNGDPDHFVRLNKNIGKETDVHIWYQCSVDPAKHITDIVLTCTKSLQDDEASESDSPGALEMASKGYTLVSHPQMTGKKGQPSFGMWARSGGSGSGRAIAALSISYTDEDESRNVSLGFQKIEPELQEFGLPPNVFLWLKKSSGKMVAKKKNDMDALTHQRDGFVALLSQYPSNERLKVLLKQTDDDIEALQNADTTSNKIKDMVEFLGLSEKEILLFVSCFKTMDTDRSGKVDIDEFTEYLGLGEKELPYLLASFKSMDVMQRKADHLDFAEFIYVVGTYCMFGTRQILQLAFTICNTEGKPYITPSELKQVLILLNNVDPMEIPATRKIIEIYESRGGGKITFDTFKDMHRCYPNLLFPAFRVQKLMMKAFLGVKFWKKKRLLFGKLRQQGA